MPAVKSKQKILPPVRPNVGVEVTYRKRLQRLIDEMNNSIGYWLAACYGSNPPAIAQDELPAAELLKTFRQLRRRWLKKFNDAAPKIARAFAESSKNHVDNSFQKILEDAGMVVDFKMTSTVRDVFTASVAENVGLIKSIASENLTDVEGILMRSVTVGRDLGTMTQELEKRFDLTRKRASLIARDQNNKATAVITLARQQEAGILKARWLHSSAGKKPRPDHVAFSQGKLGGPEYDVSKGALISGEWIYPGQLINCRCVSRPILEGF